MVYLTTVHMRRLCVTFFEYVLFGVAPHRRGHVHSGSLTNTTGLTVYVKSCAANRGRVHKHRTKCSAYDVLVHLESVAVIEISVLLPLL